LATDLTEQALGQPRRRAHVHRHSALDIGQREGIDVVTTMGGADQIKQRAILRDGQKLAIGKGPTVGREIETGDSDLSDKRIAHGDRPSRDFAGETTPPRPPFKFIFPSWRGRVRVFNARFGCSSRAGGTAIGW
jgi:hypothetical protein